MRRHRPAHLAPAVGAFAALLAVTACAPSDDPVPTPDPQPEQTASVPQVDPDAVVQVAVDAEPTSIAALPTGDAAATRILGGNVYEALTRLDATGEVELALAESIERSDDGLSYTIAVRPDVVFHSGAPLTADDVASSIDRAADRTSGSAAAAELAMISGVTAVDDLTVRIDLQAPSISLPYRLSQVWISPSDDETSGGIPSALAPGSDADGTGPYVLDGWARGSSMTLSPNEAHWGEAPANGGVVFHFFDDAAGMATALAAGIVDVVAGDLGPADVAAIPASDGVEVIEGRSTTLIALDFGDSAPAFRDPLVREAVSAAIDDEALLADAWGSGGTVIGSMAGPADPWYEDLAAVDVYDPDLARDLLDEAGYDAGFAFALAVPDDPVLEQTAEAMREQLAEVGVSAEIRATGSAPEAPMAGGDAALVAIDRPRALAFPESAEAAAIDDVDARERIGQAEMTTSEAEQAEVLRLVAAHLAESSASEWLFSPPRVTVAAAHVAGIAPDRPSCAFEAAGIEISR